LGKCPPVPLLARDGFPARRSPNSSLLDRPSRLQVDNAPQHRAVRRPDAPLLPRFRDFGEDKLAAGEDAGTHVRARWPDHASVPLVSRIAVELVHTRVAAHSGMRRLRRGVHLPHLPHVPHILSSTGAPPQRQVHLFDARYAGPPLDFMQHVGSYSRVQTQSCRHSPLCRTLFSFAQPLHALPHAQPFVGKGGESRERAKRLACHPSRTRSVAS
jgi:hypothetical protein